MSYCLNPTCSSPHNPQTNAFCQACGQPLLFAERYRALELIGRGGFGRTVLAVDVALPDSPRCVIKQILPRQGDRHDAKDTERFRQEAARLRQLGHHAQVPEFLDAIETPEAHYLIQQYIDGRNLETVLEERGPFPGRGIRQLLLDLLPVLDYLHQRRVIHRDIKPQNLIAPPDNQRVVLVDFGASKIASGTALARTGTVIGSAGYLAPEQAMGKAVFSSDLYSLGVTCAHLLTGMHPFELYSVSQDAWVWQQYLLNPISESLAYVINKMIRRSINQRYRTAAAVLEDLRSPPAALEQTQGRSISRNMPKFLSPRSSEPSRNLALDASEGLSETNSEINAVSDAAAEAALGEVGYPNSGSSLPLPEQPWYCVHQLAGHDGSVTAIAISPSGQVLASGSTDRRIVLWNLQSGTKLHVFEGRSLWNNQGHRDRINALQFTPDGSVLVSASDDGTIKLWDLAERTMISTLSSTEWVISRIALSGDGTLLIGGGANGAIELWNLAQREFIERLWKHEDRISGLSLSPNGQTLISSSWDGTLRLWDLRTADLLDTLRAHRSRVGAIATSADWRMLVSGSWDGELTFWDLERSEAVRTLQGHREAIRMIVAHPHAQLFASGGDDTRVSLWSVGDEKRLYFNEPVGSPQSSPASAHLQNAPEPRRDRPLWNLEKVDRFCVLKHAWSVNALAFSPDGLTLVSGSADESIKVWRQSESI